MTRRRPDAWAQCSKCGRRIRASDNTTGLCSRCSQGTRDQRYARTLFDRRLALLRDVPAPALSVQAIRAGVINFARAYDIARSNGHDMLPIERDDGPGTFVSQCMACLGFLVGDPDEQDVDGSPMPLYGRAYDTACPGEPPQPPALRRDPMDMAASSTSLSHEWPDREPVYLTEGHISA